MDTPTILIIDDKSSNLRLMTEALHDEFTSVEILYAPNGKDGYEVALLEAPDIIIMDWAMPLMNGIDSLMKLKAKEETKEIPVIMSTGVMTDPEDVRKSLEAGAIDFIRKPFEKLELVARVQAALRLDHSYKELKEKNKTIEEMLAQKDRELSHMAITSHERDKFLTALHEELNELKKRPSDRGFNKINQSIKRQVSTKDSWNSFMFHFNNVHPDYLASLKKAGLTSNELKLAAYLKIGLGNKEIASMTGVEPVTVKSNLHRLKKKMGLSATQDLRKYFQSLSYKA